MDAFIYQSALYCAPCGEAIAARLPLPPAADLDNESTFDSDEYPKGPFSNGGGEADCPQHCDACGAFLDNPLTPEGESRVAEALAPFIAAADLDLWTHGSFAGFIADRIETAASNPPAPALPGFKPAPRPAPCLAEWARAYDWLVKEPAEVTA